MLANAGLVCLLAHGNQNNEPGSAFSVFYLRAAIPFLAFGLILVRMVSYAEHVLLYDARVYWRDCGSYVVGEEMRVYKLALIAGHVVVGLALAFEMWAGGRMAVLVTLSAGAVLQAVESRSHRRDVWVEEVVKARPPSPESMV